MEHDPTMNSKSDKEVYYVKNESERSGLTAILIAFIVVIASLFVVSTLKLNGFLLQKG